IPCSPTLIPCSPTLIPCSPTLIPCSPTLIPCSPTLIPCSPTLIPCSPTLIPCSPTLIPYNHIYQSNIQDTSIPFQLNNEYIASMNRKSENSNILHTQKKIKWWI
uniref:Uncharacterized protein n=1 Tax=Oncorhynchus tshawytscha TaxID=74940 RepID=A0AAZ3Q6V6_ONCTS